LLVLLDQSPLSKPVGQCGNVRRTTMRVGLLSSRQQETEVPAIPVHMGVGASFFFEVGQPGPRRAQKALPMLPKPPPNVGVVMAKKSRSREWTKDDVRELKTLARQKTPVAKIAKSLKRTPGATQQKAFALGVSLDSRG
jgi:hypothetical protein